MWAGPGWLADMDVLSPPAACCMAYTGHPKSGAAMRMQADCSGYPSIAPSVGEIPGPGGTMHPESAYPSPWPAASDERTQISFRRQRRSRLLAIEQARWTRTTGVCVPTGARRPLGGPLPPLKQAHTIADMLQTLNRPPAAQTWHDGIGFTGRHRSPARLSAASSSSRGGPRADERGLAGLPRTGRPTRRPCSLARRTVGPSTLVVAMTDPETDHGSTARPLP